MFVSLPHGNHTKGHFRWNIFNRIQSYLEEFTFRFNRRTASSRGQLFRRLLEQAVSTQPVTQADTLHGDQWETEKKGNKQVEQRRYPLFGNSATMALFCNYGSVFATTALFAT